MSKAWFIAALLGLTGGVVFAKDKGPASDKGHNLPSRSSGTPHHAPAHAHSTPATTRPSPSAAPVQRSTPAPAINVSPSSRRSSQSSARIEHAPHRAEQPSHRTQVPPSQPALPTPATTAPKTTKNPPPNLRGSATSVPSGKVGQAIGPLPAPHNGKIEPGKPLVSAAQKQSGHKHTSGKPASPGSNGISPLPKAPKFETNGKIPPIGSSLAGSSTPAPPVSNHNHKAEASPRPPSGSLPATQHSSHSHTGHHHSTHQHGASDHSRHRHSRGLSWLIVGNSLLGPSSYGYGYGSDYCGPVDYGPTYVYVPTPVITPNVNIDSYSAGTIAPPPQQQLTPDEFAALPLDRQRELLLQALNALEEDFASLPNGETWSRHLQLATIAKLVTDGEDRPTATLRVRLRSVVRLFDEVAASVNYKAVSELASFRVLHVGLHEFAAEDIDRSRRQLSNAASNLSKSLEAWSSGPRWRDYLQVAWMIGTDEESQIDLEARLVRFEKLLEKFDRVKSDDQFEIVTQSREFQLVHAALRRFIGDLQRLINEVRESKPQVPEAELNLPASPS